MKYQLIIGGGLLVSALCCGAQMVASHAPTLPAPTVAADPTTAPVPAPSAITPGQPVVKVNGAQGTLLNMAGRRGPTYALLWSKNGIVYSLTGFGDPSDAVSLANSLQ